MLTVPFDTLSVDDFVSQVSGAVARHQPSDPARFVLLGGSGISAPALPTTIQILQEHAPIWCFAQAYRIGPEAAHQRAEFAAFRHEFWENIRRRSQLRIALDAAGRPQFDDNATMQAAYVAVMGRFNPALSDAQERRAFLRYLLESAGPQTSEAVVYLASLLSAQDQWDRGSPWVQSIFLTNFDRLLPKMLQFVGKGYFAHSLTNAFSDNPLQRDLVQLFYLHGTVDEYRVPSDTDDARQESSQFETAVSQHIEQRGLIAIGTSGWPGALLRAVRRCDRFAHNLYWCDIHPAENAAHILTPAVREILTRFRGSAYYVQIPSADELLRSLHQEFGLGSAPEILADPLRPLIRRLDQLKIASANTNVGADKLSDFAAAARVRLHTLLEDYERTESEALGQDARHVRAHRAALQTKAARLRAEDRHDDAIAILNNLINADDVSVADRMELICRRSESFKKLRRSSEYERDLASVIQSHETPSALRAWALLERAAYHHQQNLLDQAIADFHAAIDLDGLTDAQHIQAILGRGLTAQKSGDAELAIADLSTVIDDDRATPDQRATALFTRAITAQAAQDYATAIADYTALLEMSNVRAEARTSALTHRASCRRFTGDYARACEDCDQLLASDDLSDAAACDLLMIRASCREAQGNLQGALEDHHRILQASGTEDDVRAAAHDSSGRVLRALDRDEDALKQYDKVVALKNADGDIRKHAFWNRAEIHRNRNRVEQAIADYSEYLRLESAPSAHRADAHYSRGQLYSQMDNEAAAQRDYSAAIEIAAAKVDTLCAALNQRGIARRRAGDIAGAIADYTRVIDHADARPEQKAAALNNRGVARRKSEEVAGAIADYTAVINLEGAPAEQVVKAYNNRGVAYGVTGESEKAIADYGAVIDHPAASSEQRAKALNNRGIVLCARGEGETALNDYSAVIHMSEVREEHRAKALASRAALRAQSGNLDGAIADYSAVLALPNAPADQIVFAHNGRGQIYGIRGETQAEIDDYSAVITHRAAEPEQRAWALNNRGLAYASLENFEAAISDYSAVLEQPRVPAHLRCWALNNRAFVHRRNNNTRAEANDYEAVIAMPDALANQKAWALNNRGWLFLQERRLADAVTSFQAAVSLDENDAAGHFNYGLALFASERMDQAREEYTRGIECRPDPDKIEDALRDLKYLVQNYGAIAEVEDVRRQLFALLKNQPQAAASVTVQS
ncbi:MAG: tetratricopeptide repeat protein [Phycisphaerae bacterium]